VTEVSVPHRFGFVATKILRSAICALLAITLAAGAASAQAPQPTSTPGAAELGKLADDTVVATVDGAPIRYVDVRRQVMGALEGRKIPSQAMPLVYAQSLDQVVQRTLITAKLKAAKIEPTKEELDAAETAFQSSLRARNKTPEDYLRQTGFTADDIKAIRYWEIAWNRYAAEQLTDAALEKYFQSRKRDFDGTEVRVSHILFRVEGQQDQATIPLAIEKAKKIRSELAGKSISFADAAAKYSAGPSRAQGGDLGFIPRYGRMVEEFSRAAFALKKDEISEPVVSPFGVHLILLTEEKPGTIEWQKVREPLTAAAKLNLFHTLGAELKAAAKIEYTGAIPHLDATGNVVAGK